MLQGVRVAARTGLGGREPVQPSKAWCNTQAVGPTAAQSAASRDKAQQAASETLVKYWID